MLNESDNFIWNLHQNNKFHIKYLYEPRAMPLLITKILCFLQRGVVLSRDNLARQNWQGSNWLCLFSTMISLLATYF